MSELDRAVWLAERRQGVGASEAAALFGLDPWRSALGVWASKTHGDEVIDSEVMEIGRLLEEPVAQMFAKRFPRLRVQDPGGYRISHLPGSRLFATCDRDLEDMDAAVSDLGVLEIKASSKQDEWASGPPLRYVCQVQAQLACTGRSWGYLAALLGGRKFVAHRIERDEPFIHTLLDKVEAFWGFVERREEPPAMQHYDLAVVKMLHPDDSGVAMPAGVELSNLAEEWHQSRSMRLDAERDEKTLEGRLRQAIGDATWLEMLDGRKVQCKVEPRKAETCKGCGAEVREAKRSRVLRMMAAPKTSGAR